MPVKRWGGSRGLLAAVVGGLLAAGGAVASSDFDPAHPEGWKLPGADLYGVYAQGDTVWAVGYWGTVLRSTDGGETWTHTATPTRETLFSVSFADAQHGWAVGANGALLRSTDGGVSWEEQSATRVDTFGERSPVDVHLFGVAAVSANEAWTVGDYGLVLHTRDGSSWEQVTLSEEVFADDNLLERIFNAVDFSDPRHGWIAGEFGTTLRTNDGGKTWVGDRTLVDTPNDIYLYDISAIDGERAAISGLAGTVLTTQDGGQTWEPQRTGSSAGLFGVSWTDGRGGAAVGDRGEIFTREANPGRWIRPEQPRLFNWLADVDHADPNRIFAVGEKGLILRSEDGGLSWVQVAGAPPPPLGGVSVPPEPGAAIEPSKRSGRQVPAAPTAAPQP